MKLTVDLKLSPAQLAEAFCQMNDEEQAQFFVECAAVAAQWTGDFLQWFAVGRHLATCECSNEAARDIVREIADGIEAGSRTQEIRPSSQPEAVFR